MQKCVFLTSENVNLVYSIITKGGGGAFGKIMT